jgi:SARP family transcriptional regulator, regulator of embCAB operon
VVKATMARAPWRILGETWECREIPSGSTTGEVRDHERIMTATAARIQMCGRLTVEVDGVRREQALPGPQGALVFAFLVAHRDQPTTRDAVCAELWPRDEAGHEAALNALVSRVRRVAPCQASAGTLRLELPAGTWVDLEAARDAIHRAESAIAQHQWERAWSASQTSLFVGRRGFVLGGEGAWADVTRRELELLHQRSLEAYARAALGLGNAELATAETAARELVRIAPLRESAHRLLMDALAAGGNPAEALQVYDALRVSLSDELGVSPAAETRDLYARLLG